MALYGLTEAQVARLRAMLDWWTRRPTDLRRGVARSNPSIANVPIVYKAIADESGGEIQVKRVNADGTTFGDAIILKVLP